MDKKKKSVLVPIIFFSFFNFPLRLKEIRRYLWQQELPEDEVKQILSEISQIHNRDDLFWHGNLVEDRLAREQRANKFWQIVKRRRWIFSNIPFLKQVFVSNTLAYNNVHKNSDIDLFVVGSDDRLWTVRAFLLFWLNLFGWRVRSLNKYGKFSPEFFASESFLDIHTIALNNDYCFSFWLVNMVPVWPDGKKNLIYKNNAWVKNDLPIAWRSPKSKNFAHLKSSYFAIVLENFLSGRLGDNLEKKLYQIQKDIIQRTQSRIGVNPKVITNKNIIKLHFNDRRTQITNTINKGLNEIK